MSMSWISDDGGNAVLDRITYAVATGAATNWFWWPWIENGMQFLLTFLGIVWLAVQIYMKLRYKK